jgi:hypothetical protein
MKITNERLYDFVFTSEDGFVAAMAAEHTIANLAQEHFLHECDSILQAEYRCIEAHCDGMSEGDAEKLFKDEKKSWMKEAKATLKAIKKAGLPWTLRSSREVFDNRSKYGIK